MLFCVKRSVFGVFQSILSLEAKEKDVEVFQAVSWIYKHNSTLISLSSWRTYLVLFIHNPCLFDKSSQSFQRRGQNNVVCCYCDLFSVNLGFLPVCCKYWHDCHLFEILPGEVFSACQKLSNKDARIIVSTLVLVSYFLTLDKLSLIYRTSNFISFDCSSMIWLKCWT